MPILPVLFTIAVIAVIVWVAWSLIQAFPTYGIATVKMLLIAALVVVLIFVIASVLGIQILGGLRLK